MSPRHLEGHVYLSVGRPCLLVSWKAMFLLFTWKAISPRQFEGHMSPLQLGGHVYLSVGKPWLFISWKVMSPRQLEGRVSLSTRMLHLLSLQSIIWDIRT